MHWIQALVASQATLAELGVELPSAVIRELPQGFSLVPITDELAAEIASAGYPAKDPSPLPAQEMAPGVAALAADLSARGAVAYVATFIHGGTGGQDGLVWEAGNLTLCVQDAEDWSPSQWPNSPVSRALRKIGVLAHDGLDEFDAVGLGTHRSNEAWASSQEKIVPPKYARTSEDGVVPHGTGNERPWWKFWQ